MSAPKYQKKPVVVEAMRIPIKAVAGEEAFTAGHDSIARWLMRHGFKSFKATDDGGYDIGTLEGTMHANPGDWIIRGVQGEFYPCRNDIFEATYELADEIDRKCDVIRDGQAHVGQLVEPAVGHPSVDTDPTPAHGIERPALP